MLRGTKAGKAKRLRRAASVVLLLAGCLVLAALKPDRPVDQRKGRTMRAAEFLDALGVNTHIGSDPYNDPAKLASLLSYLGTRNIRKAPQSTPPSWPTCRHLGSWERGST